MQDRQLAYDRISQLPQELLSVTSLALSETDKTLIILHLGASPPLPLPFVGLPLPVHDLIPLVHTTDSAILKCSKAISIPSLTTPRKEAFNKKKQF
jgi:hypothetical protein